MSQPLTIVMYHFVRDLPRTRYPAIKGLLTAKFIGQLAWLQSRYRIVTMEQCVEALGGGKPLPEHAALLTFDDGYLDHYTTVFPLLEERGWQGSFFPPARAITEGQVLDVNKIHFILAAAEPQAIKASLLAAVDEQRSAYGLRPNADYLAELHHPSRFDTAEVIFIKRMLQRELPEVLRAQIADDLFRQYVSTNEQAFARELYVDVPQLRTMVRHGMYVGSHGHGHFWMNTLSPAEQAREVDLSLDFLATVGAPTQSWTMCYPYGAHNPSLVEVVRSKGAAVGLTTEVAVADLSTHSAWTLPRLDTNDLPQPLPDEPALSAAGG